MSRRGRDVALVARRGRGFQRDFGHHADQQRFRTLNAQEFADRDGDFVGGIEAFRRQADARLRAADRENPAAGPVGIEN